jgi:tetratricopeptide (TPR) repeat protein
VATWNLFRPAPDILALAEAAAGRAIQLDASLGEAYASRAMVLASRGAYDDANRSFRRAIDLNPGSVWSHHFYTLLLIMQLRLDEARRENSRALLIDPLNPAANSGRGVLLLLNGDTTGAHRVFRAAIGISPHYVVPSYHLGTLEAAGGNYTEARALLEHAHARGARFPGVRSALAYTHLAGWRTRTLLILCERTGRPRSHRSRPRGGTGDIDRAFALLEGARWTFTTHDSSSIAARSSARIGATALSKAHRDQAVRHPPQLTALSSNA